MVVERDGRRVVFDRSSNRASKDWLVWDELLDTVDNCAVSGWFASASH
jgi:hypothetical protein